MPFTIPQFFLALPEITLLGMICVCTMLEVFRKSSHKHLVYYVSQLSLIIATVLLIVNISGQTSLGFSGEFIKDLFGSILKIFICLIILCVFVFSRQYLEERNFYQGEFYILGLIGTLGMMVMVSSGDFIMLYVSLEVSALSMYAMIAMHRENAKAIEAAIKYFILGSMASGILLFGVSMIYGATGSLQFAEIAASVQHLENPQSGGNKLILYMGVALLMIGLIFKMGGAPFHLWMPDVYDGSPTAVTSYLSAAPKLAVFAILFRTLTEGLLPVFSLWHDLLVVVVILSLIVGNVVAIAQTNLKRMLAYSAVSHIGFVLMGFLTGNEKGYASAMFYVIVYAIMTLVAFAIVIIQANKDSEMDKIEDLKGLIKRNPFYALATTIIMLSLSGIPPTGGFYAKFLVLEATVNYGLEWLALLAVVMSIIGAFYYLRVIKNVLFDEPDENWTHINIKLDQRILFTFLSISLIYLGIFPNYLIEWCKLAIAGY